MGVKKHESTQTNTMTSEVDGVKTVVKKTMVNGFLVKKETSTIKNGVTAVEEETEYHNGDDSGEVETGDEEDDDDEVDDDEGDDEVDDDEEDDDEEDEFLGEDDITGKTDPKEVEKEINDFLSDDEEGRDDISEDDTVEIVREEL